MPRRLVIGKWNRGKIEPSELSRAGVHYVAANNDRIRNEGEVNFKFNTSSGDLESMCFQVAEVNKALAAVSSLVDSSHRVVFDNDMKTGAEISFIIDKKKTSVPRCDESATSGSKMRGLMKKNLAWILLGRNRPE